MTKKMSKFLKKQVDAVKDLAVDLIPRFAALLDSKVLQDSETIKAGLINVATGFVASRVGGMLKDISTDKNIDQEVLENQKSKQVLLELAKFAAQENPDIEVWDAAKNIFIRTLKKDVKDQERASLYELISICKELRGTEIRILAAAYKIFKLGKNLGPTGNQRNVYVWAADIAADIGLETPEEVLRYEENLIRQKLIVPREILRGDIHETWVGAGSTMGHRLTSLGRKLAESLSFEGK